MGIPVTGYGVCGFGYGMGKSHPRYTRVQPYPQLGLAKMQVFWPPLFVMCFGAAVLLTKAVPIDLESEYGILIACNGKIYYSIPGQSTDCSE